MDIFEEDFSELVELIRTRRITDAELDDICKDYELLKTDLGNAQAEESNPDLKWQAELQTVLTELKNEIHAKAKTRP